jgi:peptidoglycan/LPS O-acetylase OafA/YrhL
MIDFAAAATLAIRFRSVLKPLAIQPLVILGQASLQVFCVHLVCVFFALTIMGDNEIVSGWLSVVVILISLSALVLTAKISATRRAKAKANHAGPDVNIPPPVDYGKGLDPKAA